MNEPIKPVENPLCMIIFVLPVAIYELRVAWLYFRRGRIITPLGYHFMSLATLFLPYTMEEYMEWVNKTYNWKPRTLALFSGLHGLFWLMVVIFSIISSIFNY